MSINLNLDKFCEQVHYGTVAGLKPGDNSTRIALGFLNSMEINVFPCSRRNSSIIESQKEGQSHYYFPYDPEARLTTEANKIKETSSNGFTQTYIKSVNFFDTVSLEAGIDRIVHYPDQKNSAHDTTGKNDVNFSTLPGFNFVIGGYNFNIPLNNPKCPCNLNAFATTIISALAGLAEQATTDKLYANIRLVNVPLYSLGDSGTVVVDGDGNSPSTTRTIVANTWILRDQFEGAQGVDVTLGPPPPAAHLDALKTSATTSADVRSNLESFYFSGLSFSTEPLTGLETTSYSEVYLSNDSQYDQRVISILLLINKKKDDESLDNWVLNQRALLPNIWHGEEEDSVEITNLRTRGNLEINGDVHITGHIKANTGSKIAQFYDVDIDNNLDVDGQAHIDGDFYVGGQTLLNGDVHLCNDLKVDQDAEVRNLTVSGTPDTPGKIQSSDILTTNIHVTGFASRLHGSNPLGFLTAEVVTDPTPAATTDTTVSASDGDMVEYKRLTNGEAGGSSDRPLGFRNQREAKRLILHAENKQAPDKIRPNDNIVITESEADDVQINNLKFSLAAGAELDKDIETGLEID